MSLCKELAFQLILVLESIRFSNDNLVRCLYRHSTTCVLNFLKWMSLLVAASFKNRVLSEFGNGKYLQLQEAIDNNTITSAQVEALKDEIEDQVLALLGPFRILLVEIPIISDLEDAVADIILGDHIEEIRDGIANVSIPQPFSDLLCEN